VYRGQGIDYQTDRDKEDRGPTGTNEQTILPIALSLCPSLSPFALSLSVLLRLLSQEEHVLPAIVKILELSKGLPTAISLFYILLTDQQSSPSLIELLKQRQTALLQRLMF
jgi:hypothetical protein